MNVNKIFINNIMSQNLVMSLGKKQVKNFNMVVKKNKKVSVKPIRRGVTYEMFPKISKTRRGCGCGGF